MIILFLILTKTIHMAPVCDCSIKFSSIIKNRMNLKKKKIYLWIQNWIKNIITSIAIQHLFKFRKFHVFGVQMY
jgi:hypothetical protein